MQNEISLKIDNIPFETCILIWSIVMNESQNYNIIYCTYFVLNANNVSQYTTLLLKVAYLGSNVTNDSQHYDIQTLYIALNF